MNSDDSNPVKLPLNCIIHYFADFLDSDEADELYRCLIDEYHISQAQLEIMAGGRFIKTDSFKIFFASEDLMQRNSHPESIHGKSHLWTGRMATLRDKVNFVTGREFELAMCLFYPNGEFFAPDHDDQQTSGAATIISSLSLGAQRPFHFIEKDTGDTYSLELGHGSLLVMGEHSQSRYVHGLPKDHRCTRGRINITFRDANFQ